MADPIIEELPPIPKPMDKLLPTPTVEGFAPEVIAGVVW